ncbi:MAG: hypothetical protein ACKN9M_07420 [Burkholderiaceae bacterium]
MKNIKFAQIASLAALILGTTPAIAAVIFDPSTGIGFVGKGDVQDAFLWNNQQLQTNAPGLEFKVVQTRQWTATCTDADGKQEIGDGKFKALKDTTYSIDSKPGGGGSNKVNSDPRLNPQKMVTGFTLSGYRGAGLSNNDSPPAVGSNCARGNIIGTWTSVVVSGTTELTVNYGGIKRVLAVY